MILEKNDEKLMKQIGYRIILVMFILNGRVLSCSTIVLDRDNKSVVSTQQKNQSTPNKICWEFRDRLAKQSPANLYQLPDVLLALVIDFTGKKWDVWSTKQLFSVPRAIAAYGNNSIVIPQEHGVQIVDLTDIDAHCKKFPCSEISQVGPLVVLPDGRVATALVASPLFGLGWIDRQNRYKIDIWNARSNVVEQELRGNITPVRALVVLPGNRLLSELDGRYVIWNLNSGKRIQCLHAYYLSSSLIAMPDNILIVGRNEGIRRIILLDCCTGAIVDAASSDYGVSCLAKVSDTLFVSGSYKKLISGANSSPINIWSRRGKRVDLVRSLAGHTGTISALIVLPNEKLASASNDGTIRIWNYETGDCLATLNNHDAIHSLVAMPNGSFLSTSGKKTLRIWKEQMDCAHYEPFQKN
jgi:WD40 repeat protein